MAELKGNSIQAVKSTLEKRPAKPNQERAITGPAVVISQEDKDDNRFISNFISGDIKEVKHYIWKDVIVPSIKSLVYETISGGLRGLLYKGDYPTPMIGNSSLGNRVRYGKIFDESRLVYPNGGRNTLQNAKQTAVSTSSTVAIGDYIWFRFYNDATNFINQMQDIIETYDRGASILDAYEIASLPTESTTDKYGWKEFGVGEPVPYTWQGTRGYIVKLPKPVPLD